MSVAVISEVTGLSVDEIKKLSDFRYWLLNSKLLGSEILTFSRDQVD
jgi:hypothetical protein